MSGGGSSTLGAPPSLVALGPRGGSPTDAPDAGRPSCSSEGNPRGSERECENAEGGVCATNTGLRGGGREGGRGGARRRRGVR